MKVYNHDIYGLVKRLRRFKFEMIKSVSANLGEASAHDMRRLESYLSAMKEFKAWMTAQPELDLPETSPMEMSVGEAPVLPEIDNDDLDVIFKLMNLLELELVNSQSARRSTGLVSHDSDRFDALVAKIENFIGTYMATANPLDLPESLPVAPMAGPGRTGV